MLSQKLITSPIEYRVYRARELLEKGKYYHIKNYNLFVICSQFTNDKFILPTKKDMFRYHIQLNDLLDWL